MNYRIYKEYGQQVFEIYDDTLNKIIEKYIFVNGLQNNDYLFSLLRNKKEVFDETNFSSKVGNVFKKVYNVPITIRILRISWSSYLHYQNLSVALLEMYTEMMTHSLHERSLYKK